MALTVCTLTVFLAQYGMQISHTLASTHTPTHDIYTHRRTSTHIDTHAYTHLSEQSPDSTVAKVSHIRKQERPHLVLLQKAQNEIRINLRFDACSHLPHCSSSYFQTSAFMFLNELTASSSRYPHSFSSTSSHLPFSSPSSPLSHLFNLISLF